MKSLVESILSSTSTGKDGIVYNFFDKWLSNLNDNEYKITIKDTRIHIDRIPKMCSFNIIDGDLYGNLGTGEHVKFPSGFVLENCPVNTFGYFSGKLPKCLYGTEFEKDAWGRSLIEIQVERDANTKDIHAFFNDLLKKCELPEDLRIGNSSSKINIQEILGDTDFGERNIEYAEYDSSDGGISLYLLKNLQCKCLYLRHANPCYVCLLPNSKTNQKLNLNAAAFASWLSKGTNHIDKDAVQKGLKEVSQNNKIQYFKIPSSNSKQSTNIYWSPIYKIFDTRVVSSTDGNLNLVPFTIK